jgi:hypothetical protein
MTVLANNRSHNKSIFSLISSSLLSILTSIIFPILKDLIPSTPSLLEADFIASPADQERKVLTL